MLPVDKTANILNISNQEELKKLKSNIIHEMCHVELLTLLPKLHKKHELAIQKENYITAFVIIIYIEYLAHLKSVQYESIICIDEFFKSINIYDWDFKDEMSKTYMIKTASYIITRDSDKRVKGRNYIENLKNIELKEKIKEVKILIENTKLFDDNYGQLLRIEEFVTKYI